jgi:hypothetical protein
MKTSRVRSRDRRANFQAAKLEELARVHIANRATLLFVAKNFLLLCSICAMLLKIFCAKSKDLVSSAGIARKEV